MSEENREAPRRRRRADRYTETDSFPQEPAGESETNRKSLPEAESGAAQAPDSRIPPEARRMSAAPYGAVNAAAARRPGTRPPQAVRRPPQAQPVRPQRGNGTQAEATQPVPAARIQVGYASGRMGPPTEEMQEKLQQTRAQQPARGMQENRFAPRRAEERPPFRQVKRHPILWTITTLLLAAGLAAVLLLILPEDHFLRASAAEIVRKITVPVEEILTQRTVEPARIDNFTVTDNERVTAPVEVIFSVTTESSISNLRLVDEDGNAVETGITRVENTENNVWTLTLRVKDGYEGTLLLQTRREGEPWQGTEYSAPLSVISGGLTDSSEPPIATLAPNEEETPEPPEADSASETKALSEDTDAAGAADSGNAEAGSPEQEPPEHQNPEEDAAEDSEDGEPEDEDSDEGEPEDGESEDGEPENGEEEEEETEQPTATPTPEPTPTLTLTPEPTPEPTPTPALTAEAAPGANPNLITLTTVYTGSRKEKDYHRAAKELIHMPTAWNYTTQKIGVLTFRGNAFRTNAAVGNVVSANGLTQIWQAAAGSARGASQTYYGYEWTGQPAIVKWSTQVRQGSNIDVDKQAKAPLLEVIIAGVDGVIRFLDLEDGTLTRSAINLGYPMKGTPSLHPSGYPYMCVGQSARKMKVKTGKIGLRQYNLYTQKEMSLIDGLDGKLHRGLNKYGSFETSALIDRTSDTMITLGTNGLLYLTSLNTSFDYKSASLKTNPSTVVMASQAKGQKKNNALVAVESSPAMYDRYVFYADMGGVLRCVDTNFLTTVWAVETGDAVMSAVALDFNGSDALDLYTANMLANRKKGNAQIRRYDAMTGKELWNVEVGVQKEAKKKEDVGFKASPVIGEHGLQELVYYTVTGLSDAGREKLGTGEEAKAAVIALEKETGRIRWTRELSDRSESSPVAVYDADGNGWIVQCAEDGTMLLLNGLTGEQAAELKLEGQILASPAVYNDILVIGTSGKGTEYVYGVRIR